MIVRLSLVVNSVKKTAFKALFSFKLSFRLNMLLTDGVHYNKLHFMF